MYYNANMAQYGVQRAGSAQSATKVPRGAPAYQKSNGYQLKVGGVVVGSWANGARNAQAARMNRTGMVRSFSNNIIVRRNLADLFSRFATQSTNEHLVVQTFVTELQVQVGSSTRDHSGS